MLLVLLTVHVDVDEVVVEAEAGHEELGEVDDERDEGAGHAVVLVRFEPLVQLERVACTTHQTTVSCEPRQLSATQGSGPTRVAAAGRRRVVDLTAGHLLVSQHRRP